MDPARRYTLVEIIDGLRAVRAAIINAVEPLPADACFRGHERMVLDLVWELLWPHEPDEYLAALLWYEHPDLDPAPSWQRRQEAMLRRYWHSLQVVIDFAETLTEADLLRVGTRGGKPTTLYDALCTTINHDWDYADRLRRENIPYALSQAPLPAVRVAAPVPANEAIPRRDAAAAELEAMAADLAPLLERINWQQAFAGRGQRVSDLLMHCSYRPVLTEITKRLTREENPELGQLATPFGFWDYLRPALLEHMGATAARWRSFDGATLQRSGQLGGTPYNVSQAIEDDLARFRANVATSRARAKR